MKANKTSLGNQIEVNEKNRMNLEKNSKDQNEELINAINIMVSAGYRILSVNHEREFRGAEIITLKVERGV